LAQAILAQACAAWVTLVRPRCSDGGGVVPLAWRVMTHTRSPEAALARFLRARRRGYIVQRPTGGSHVLVEAPVAGRVKVMAKALSLHHGLEQQSGRHHHDLVQAVLAAGPLLSSSQRRDAMALNRAAGQAKHGAFAAASSSRWADVVDDSCSSACASPPRVAAGVVATRDACTQTLETAEAATQTSWPADGAMEADPCDLPWERLGACSCTADEVVDSAVLPPVPDFPILKPMEEEFVSKLQLVSALDGVRESCLDGFKSMQNDAALSISATLKELDRMLRSKMEEQARESAARAAALEKRLACFEQGPEGGGGMLVGNPPSVNGALCPSLEREKSCSRRDDEAEFIEYLSSYDAFVRTVGLSDAKYNGRIGQSIGEAPSAGRFQIRLAGVKDIKCIKLCNLIRYKPDAADICVNCGDTINLFAMPECSCDSGSPEPACRAAD